MPQNDAFQAQVERLKGDLVAQGRRVRDQIELAFEAIFARDNDKAQRVIEMDESVDKADVELEKAAVALLTEATAAGNRLEPIQLRWVLMIVKVNNELERIADVGVSIAEECRLLQETRGELPLTFRVLANSTIGVLRDAVASLDKLDPELARMVLLSEETIAAFKTRLTQEAMRQLQAGKITPEISSAFHDVAMQCVGMANHCTNIAEQVMYTATGKIVRHMQGHWEEVRFKS